MKTRLVLLVSAFALLSACTTTGLIEGRMAGQIVSLEYQHTFWDTNGSLTTRLPDGENYAGKFVISSQNTTGIGVGDAGDLGVISGVSKSSNAAAVLFGDRGGSMHCNFTLRKPSSGLEGGGVGRCELFTQQVSEQQPIPVQVIDAIF